VDLAVNEWPVLGMPGAANVAVFLFDYTCRECRHMRRLIAEALDRHPAKLAVLLVPIPMDPEALGTDATSGGVRISDDRPDAIGYVRLAWALWRADPLAYVRFDHWLSGPPCAPRLRDAVAAARKLAPGADLDTSGGSELAGFIDERIARAIAIYRALEDQPVPALLFPGTALRGHVETAEELARIIERAMGIDREPPRLRAGPGRPAAGRSPVGARSGASQMRLTAGPRLD